METGSVHQIGLPMKIYIGNGILDSLDQYLEQLKVRPRIFIITGSNVRNVVVNKILDNIKKFEPIIGEVNRAELDEVERIEEEVRDTRAGFILGIGGGKSIDIAKYTAYRTGLNFMSIPTAPSHDGITSPFASIKGLNRPVSVKAKEPLAIVADIDILSRAPPRLIKSGIGDTVGKLISVRDWQLASKLRGEYYGDYTASLALLSAKHAIKAIRIFSVNIKESVRLLMEALISSGVAMGMAGSTRPASGSEHLFAHALELLEPDKGMHGELVALGTIVMGYIHNINWKKLRRLFIEIGIPVSAGQIGIREESVIKALSIAHTIRPERFTILGDKGITDDAAEKIARETMII